jgi:hypothetical protein
MWIMRLLFLPETRRDLTTPLIVMPDGLNDAVWLKEVPFETVNARKKFFEELFPLYSEIWDPYGIVQSKRKGRKTFER